MSWATVLFIAVGLSMDAFAVAVANGFAIKKIRKSHAFTMSLSFGMFQALMPIVGWLAGLALRDYIKGFDHWIAFGLLIFVGGKMILESREMEKPEEKEGINFYTLMLLSLATSIDALAVGLSLSVLNVPVITPALVIGAVTFVLSYLGVCIGARFGHVFESKVEAIGGVVLIGIGTKILIDHLIAGN